jgi:hypothetical protein
MSAKSDKAEIVQRINAAVKSAGLPELPFDLLHKADAVTLNLFYDRWLTVALGRIMGGPPTIRGRTRGEFGPIEMQILPPEPKKQPTGMTGPTGPVGSQGNTQARIAKDITSGVIIEPGPRGPQGSVRFGHSFPRGKLPQIGGSEIGSEVSMAYCRKCKEVVTFLNGALTVGDDGMVTCAECQGLCGRPPFVG